MVIDSNSAQRGKDDRGANNLRKKPGISKGECSPVSASAKTGSAGLRRSTRGTTSKEQITSTSSAIETPPGKESSSGTSNIRMSERLVKKDTSPPSKRSPPAKRKLEVLEKKKLLSSPLRRSDRGKKQPSPASPGSNNNGKVTALPDVNRKQLREKSVNQLTLESKQATGGAEEVKRINGQIIKNMNGRTFKRMFRQQRIRDSGPNLEEVERPEKLPQDDRICLRLDISSPVEDGEEVVERYREGGKEQFVSQSSNANAHALSNHGELEISCLNSKNGSRDTLTKPSEVNGANAFDGSTIGDESIDESERLQVAHASVCPEMEILPDGNFVVGTGVVPSSSSECDKDNHVAPCTQCCKRRRLDNNSLAQDLCPCNNAPTSDFKKALISENRVEPALCDDSLNDAVNDGNLSTHAICKLDEKLTPDSSRFIEYWVPVSASNVQLEQYCATLLSNSMTLRSSSSTNIVGVALHNILFSTKKCCDHPYFVDPGLQGFLTKDFPPVEYLDVGIKASGKLQLLDTVLPEIKRLGKRVLILYQSIRSAGMLTGDLLDDFLRQRFGSDSYERVDKGIIPSKKQTALNKFNSKDSGRFVFLLEKHACSPTVKLSFVDAVVIFDSDWNLMSDNRALHKLSIDSSAEPIKILRLYTSCTLEEKVLDLATNHVTLDINLHHINRTTSHMLLMYGASYLFNKLAGFHANDASKSGASLCSDTSMQKDVAGEVLDLFLQNADNSCKNSLITKVRHTRETYNKNAPLFGESKVESTDGKEPHLFWNELLECRNPPWRFLPESQRNRKRTQYFGDLPEKPDGGPDDVTKKQKKTVSINADAASPRARLREGGSGIVSPKSTASVLFPSNQISPGSEVPKADLEEGTKLGDMQKDLHGHLKSTISELGDTLQLPENVKRMSERFLEYIVDNHQIHSEPSTILQAFQISLMWMAASLVQYKLDKKKSIDVARQHLRFCCTEVEVSNVHSKLRELKEKFKERLPKSKEFEPTKKISDDRLKKILYKCEKRKKKLVRRHDEEIQEFNRIWEEKKAKTKNQHKVDSSILRNIFQNQAVRLERLKQLDIVFAKKMDKHKYEKELSFQELKRKQLDESNEEEKKADSWLQEITVSERVGPSENKFQDGQENVGPISGENQSPNRTEMIEVATTIPMTTVSSESLCNKDTTMEHVGSLGCSGDASTNTAVCDLPYTAERISDEAPCAHETAPNESSGGAKSLEASNCDVEFNKVVVERAGIDMSDPDFVENCNDTDDSLRPSIITTTTDRQNEASGVTIEIPSVGSQESLLGTNPDGAPSGAPETEVTAPNECAGGAKSVETSNPDSEYNKENTKNNDTDQLDPAPVEDSQKNRSGNIRSDGNMSKETHLVTSPAVQILETGAQYVLSQNTAPQDECPRQSTSAGILHGDATGGEDTTNTSEQAEVEILCPTDAEARQAEPCTASLVLNDGETHTNESYKVTDLIDGAPPSAPPVSEQVENHLPHVEQLSALNGEPSTVEPEENRLPPLTTQIVDEAPNDEGVYQSAPLNPEQTEHNLPHVEQPPSLTTTDSNERRLPPLPAQIVDEVMNHDGSRVMGTPSLTDTPNVGFGPRHPSQHPQQMNSRAQPPSLLSDPLQIELERLHKEAEEINKSHEDAKLQLKSEYEKEKEEVLAELSRRYEAKLNGVEAKHMLKKRELDASHNKVFMNRILAEAFRTKCLEFRPSVSSGMYQVPSTNFLHQLLLLSRNSQRNHAVSGSPNLVPPGASQQTTLPSVPAGHPQRNSASSGSPNLVRPSTSQQTTLSSVPAVHPQRNAASSGSLNLVPPSTSQQTTLPSVPAVHPQRNAASSGSPNLVPPSTSQQTTLPSVPAVHPQRNAASSGSSNLVPPSTSQQTTLPSVPAVHPQRNAASSGSPNLVPPAVSQQTVPPVPAPPRTTPTITSMGMRQPRPLLNTHPSGTFSFSGPMRATAPHLRPSLPMSAAPNNFSASQRLPAQDPQIRPFFPAVSQVPLRVPTSLPPQQPPMQPVHHDRIHARPPNVLPREPDLGTNFVGLYLSQGGVNGGVNLARSEVVCLSDDE